MKKIIIGAYITYQYGHHPCAWKYKKKKLDEKIQDIKKYFYLSKIAEKGLIDFIFLADTPSIFEDDKGQGYCSRTTFFEPISLLSSLASKTKNIGLIGTSSTTYKHPYNIAREYSSLDHISNGRAGWNMVTSSKINAAGNFGYKQHLNHDKRYIKAKECWKIVTKLWDSWDDKSFIKNYEENIFYDKNKFYKTNYNGKYHKVFNSILNISRSPQGHPIIVQAGSSIPGKELAARAAEIIFTAQPDMISAQEFYKDIKNRIKKYKRNFNDILIMPGLSFYIGKNKKEALEKFNYLQNFIPEKFGINMLENLLGETIDINNLNKNKLLPPINIQSNSNQSRKKIIEYIATKNNLSIKELYKKIIVSRGHLNLIGSYDDVSKEIYNWFTNSACDGFNILPPVLPEFLEEFISNIIPRLQDLGIYKKKYKQGTLREKLNIPKPKNKNK